MSASLGSLMLTAMMASPTSHITNYKRTARSWQRRHSTERRQMMKTGSTNERIITPGRLGALKNPADVEG